MTKRLRLRRETLADLTADDLAGVVGGDASAAHTCYTCIRCYTGITYCGICDPH